MAKFAFMFTLKSDTIVRLMDHPAARAKVFATTAEQLGGRLEQYYWMFGDEDGLAIMELPDSHAAAAASLGLTSTGSFGDIRTQELFSSDDIAEILGVAREEHAEPVGV